MNLNARDIAKMIDLSCVRTISNKTDIEEMVAAAQKYHFGQVSILQSFIPYTKTLLKESPQIHMVGNVSFPSGSDSTTTKVFQAKEMALSGCDEIDVVMNIGKLRSGDLEEVESDVRAVIFAVNPLPVKVIIEIMSLSPLESKQACEICLKTGAAFVKTGTGWADRGTTLDDIRQIKKIIGDQIKIKASGGIRNLDSLIAMYRAGARRFGVNLKSGISIIEECLARGNSVEISL
ncbi:MAG: deoxyribose-phosphate aldolase [Chloroflexi bacterium]|nr:deoxyribose-phosphate aldolase [Chloroflexota bacterium]